MEYGGYRSEYSRCFSWIERLERIQSVVELVTARDVLVEVQTFVPASEMYATNATLDSKQSTKNSDVIVLRKIVCIAWSCWLRGPARELVCRLVYCRP